MADDQVKKKKSQADYQQLYGAGGKFQELVDKFAAGRTGGVEAEPGPTGGAEKQVEVMEEIPTQVELEKKPELKGYMEKVEEAAELKTPITDDYTGQVLLKPAQPQNVTVTLPLTEEQVVKGLHEHVWDSIRWLAEWCVRQIKMLHGRVKYRDGPPAPPEDGN